MTGHPVDKDSVVAFVRTQGRGVVATVSSGGTPEAALVGLVALDDGTILFTTRASSRKYENIARRSAVALVVGTEGEVSLQIEGTATIASAERRAELADVFLSHAPGSRVRDPAFALVIVTPTWVRSYDVSGAEAVVREEDWTAGP